ncbi:MAG: sulfotransferase [bacterium]|nr:sulfotransferase [bacterium]
MTRTEPRRPLPIRLINDVGAGLRRLGLPLLDLDEERLLSAARKSTGHDDFGGDQFREGLRRLIDSLDDEAELNMIGRLTARTTFLGNLENRLRLQAHRALHPEVGEQQIRRPIFILGLPRTGTTILFNLLAQDPTTRAPLSWEVERPCPPPKTASYTTDPRIGKMEKQLANLSKLAPDLCAIHEFGAELPQECVAITGHEFHSVQFFIIFNVPRYQAWADEQSFVPALQFHRRFLQHLQSEHALDRWVLKTPGHLAAIEDLLEVYPDACIVHTHRDPVDVMPSLASLSFTLREMSTDAADRHFVGRQQTALWSRHLQRAVQARERLQARGDQFIDIHFDDVLKDPVDVVRRIYAHFEIPFPNETRRRMDAFIEKNPRGRHGTHRYSLEDFGLDREHERKRFAEYCERFSVST